MPHPQLAALLAKLYSVPEEFLSANIYPERKDTVVTSVTSTQVTDESSNSILVRSTPSDTTTTSSVKSRTPPLRSRKQRDARHLSAIIKDAPNDFHPILPTDTASDAEISETRPLINEQPSARINPLEAPKSRLAFVGSDVDDVDHNDVIIELPKQAIPIETNDPILLKIILHYCNENIKSSIWTEEKTYRNMIIQRLDLLVNFFQEQTRKLNSQAKLAKSNFALILKRYQQNDYENCIELLSLLRILADFGSCLHVIATEEITYRQILFTAPTWLKKIFSQPLMQEVLAAYDLYVSKSDERIKQRLLSSNLTEQENLDVMQGLWQRLDRAIQQIEQNNYLEAFSDSLHLTDNTTIYPSIFNSKNFTDDLENISNILCDWLTYTQTSPEMIGFKQHSVIEYFGKKLANIFSELFWKNKCRQVAFPEEHAAQREMLFQFSATVISHSLRVCYGGAPNDLMSIGQNLGFVPNTSAQLGKAFFTKSVIACVIMLTIGAAGEGVSFIFDTNFGDMNTILANLEATMGVDDFDSWVTNENRIFNSILWILRFLRAEWIITLAIPLISFLYFNYQFERKNFLDSALGKIWISTEDPWVAFLNQGDQGNTPLLQNIRQVANAMLANGAFILSPRGSLAESASAAEILPSKQTYRPSRKKFDKKAMYFKKRSEIKRRARHQLENSENSSEEDDDFNLPASPTQIQPVLDNSTAQFTSIFTQEPTSQIEASCARQHSTQKTTTPRAFTFHTAQRTCHRDCCAGRQEVMRALSDIKKTNYCAQKIYDYLEKNTTAVLATNQATHFLSLPITPGIDEKINEIKAKLQAVKESLAATGRKNNLVTNLISALENMHDGQLNVAQLLIHNTDVTGSPIVAHPHYTPHRRGGLADTPSTDDTRAAFSL